MAMTFPLYGLDILGYQGGLVVFTLVGVCFGFVLERAGFGQAPILAAQFYGTDMRVLKVMFTAIVTALVGLTLLAGVGLVDLSLIQVPPTYLGPALVGGLLLGVGFVVSGYCPGTSIVGLASGNVDAGFTILGVTVGSILFGPAYPLLQEFYVSGARGALQFPELLGVPQAVLALGVFVMAVGAFLFAEWAERFFSKRAGIEAPPSSSRTRNRVFVGLAVGSALALGTLALPKVVPVAEAQRDVAHLDLDVLTSTIIEHPEALWVVDLRSPSDCQDARIPGALCLSDADRDGAFMKGLPPTRKLVLYDEGEVSEVPEAALAFGGEVLVLRGGYDAFSTRFVEAPALPAEATVADVDDFRLRSAVHGWVTGVEPTPPPPPPAAVKLERPTKKGGGC
jgi:uncharacterized membrane protein YedE/YeeE